MHYPSRIAALETVFMFIRILYRLLRMSTKFRLPLNLLTSLHSEFSSKLLTLILYVVADY